MEIKNWYTFNITPFYTEWHSTLNGNELRVRMNSGTFHETIGLWSIVFWTGCEPAVIATDIQERKEAEHLAVEWMKEHPTGKMD